jgi:alanyl-tRNA synthetase
MRKKRLYPINLHFFGYEDGAGTGEGEGGGTGEPGNGNGAGGEGAGTGEGQEPAKTKTFDDILKEGSFQAEFDRRVQKALGTAKEKWSALMDDKLSEAEKLSKMNKEEKTEYLHQKQEKDIQDREAAITRRELMAEAKNSLAEKKLPTSLAEVLNYADADSCSKSIAAVEKAFQEAVQAAVEEKLKGGKPPKKAPSQEEADLAKQVEALMMGNV